MKFKNITELPDEELENTPFEFIIQKLHEICTVNLNQKLKELDLTINQANFLLVINTEETLPQSYISSLLNIQRGSVTKALKRLENKGLVEISPNPENKSKNYVKITKKGRQVTKEFNNQIKEIEDNIFENYTSEEILKLKITLRNLFERYDNL